MKNHRLLFFCLFCSALLTLSCTEAKRIWDEKTDNKSKPVAGKTSPTAKESASPATAATTPPASNSATFKGDIAGKAGKEKLYQFLEKYDQRIITLDLLLSDEQLAELNDLDKGKRWYFDLAYPDKQGFNIGGELLIDISKGKGGLRLDGNHLQGAIKITNWNGPQQGLMSINAKPAANVSNAGTSSKAIPSPSAKSQVATRPRTAQQPN